MRLGRLVGATAIVGVLTAALALPVAAQTAGPTAVNDSATVAVNGSVTIDVLANDTPSGEVTLETVSDPPNGTASISGSAVLYTPDTDFTGTDTFVYTISSGGSIDAGIVTVTVEGDNEAPVVSDDSATTDEDTAVVVDVLANDSDADGDALTVTIATEPDHGTATVDATTQEVTYTPDQDFNGTDTFTYTASDGSATSDPATVTITVNAVNDAPVANDDSATVTQDSSTVIDVLANDEDVDGDDLVIVLQSAPSNGDLTVDESAQSVTYTPGEGFTGTDSFTYQAADGSLNSETATVTIEVMAETPSDLDARVVAVCETGAAPPGLCRVYLSGQLPPWVQAKIGHIILKFAPKTDLVAEVCDEADGDRIALLCRVYESDVLPPGIQKQLGRMILDLADDDDVDELRIRDRDDDDDDDEEDDDDHRFEFRERGRDGGHRFEFRFESKDRDD